MIHAVKGDTSKAVTLDGLDLAPAGTTVTYRLKQRPGAQTYTGGAAIQDAAEGVVTFPVPNVAGRYDAEFQANYLAGDKETAPSRRADVLIVREAVT
jgi:hypothetical protein